MFWKDWFGMFGGGVCIYLDYKIFCKCLEVFDEDGIEFIWLFLWLYKLFRYIIFIILVVVYYLICSGVMVNVVLKDYF